MLRQKIITARKQQGLTQKDLAEKLGIRQATLSEFESGKRSLRSDTLETIINFLNLDIMQRKQYTEKEKISYEFGLEVRKAGEKMKAENMQVANTYGFVDLFVINDSKNGINLEYSLRHIANRLEHFSPEFYEKLKAWQEANGKFSIDGVKFHLGLLGGQLF